MVEQAADLMVIKIFWKAGWKGEAGKLPRTLSEKLKFLRLATEQHSELFAFHKDIAAACDACEPMLETRNNIVHGTASKFAADGVTYDRWTFDKNILKHGCTRITLSQLAAIATESHRIAKLFDVVDRRLMDRWPVRPDESMSTPPS